MTSLRSRLLLGAALWTAGLFIASLTISTPLLLRNPSFARALHGVALLHTLPFSLVAVICMLVGLSQVRRGVSSINQLRDRLSAVHAGRARRVEGTYPSEVQPLVDNLNALLDHQEQMVRRALAKAGDLAHGLKTPLAVLAQEAERAGAGGPQGEADITAMSATMGQQIERMRRQIEYHLAHARAAASGGTPGARCQVLESAQGLARTLQRLHAARRIGIRVDLPAAHAVRCQREDLDEMLGNLLDNACKWAKSEVTVCSSETNARIVIDVDDDGPGLAPGMRDAVLQRGVRADEAAPGSGFGLAIVCDLAELYGGTIALSDAAGGGLRARLELPGCA